MQTRRKIRPRNETRNSPLFSFFMCLFSIIFTAKSSCPFLVRACTTRAYAPSPKVIPNKKSDGFKCKWGVNDKRGGLRFVVGGGCEGLGVSAEEKVGADTVLLSEIGDMGMFVGTSGDCKGLSSEASLAFRGTDDWAARPDIQEYGEIRKVKEGAKKKEILSYILHVHEQIKGWVTVAVSGKIMRFGYGQIGFMKKIFPDLESQLDNSFQNRKINSKAMAKA